MMLRIHNSVNGFIINENESEIFRNEKDMPPIIPCRMKDIFGSLKLAASKNLRLPNTVFAELGNILAFMLLLNM